MASSNPEPSRGRRPPPILPPIGTGYLPGNHEEPEWAESSRRILIDVELANLDLRLLQIRALQSELRSQILDGFPTALAASKGNLDGAIIQVLRNLATLSAEEARRLQVLMQLRLDILEQWLELERTYLSIPQVRISLGEAGSFESTYEYVIYIYRRALASAELVANGS